VSTVCRQLSGVCAFSEVIVMPCCGLRWEECVQCVIRIAECRCRCTNQWWLIRWKWIGRMICCWIRLVATHLLWRADTHSYMPLQPSHSNYSTNIITITELHLLKERLLPFRSKAHLTSWHICHMIQLWYYVFM